MKTSILITAALLALTQARSQEEVSCAYTSLSSDITTNTTLSAGTLYRLEGDVHVTEGITLTIPAGTKILAQKASSAALIVDEGAYLVAQGTSSNPIVFTSDQAPGYRAPGDWEGIVILGQATNNASSNTISITDRTYNLSAGGNDDADSSGVLRYINIQFAKNGLTMISAGNKTVIDHIQVTNTAYNAFEFLGGTVKAKNLVSLDAYGNDFVFDLGNRSMVQFALGLRPDPAAVVNAARGILVRNDDAGSTNVPRTHPILSNFTIMGPKYCGTTPAANQLSAAAFLGRGEGSLYNSILAGWRYGLEVPGANTQAAAGTELLAAYNTFYNNHVNTDYDGGSWSSSCATSLYDFLFGTDLCSQAGNEVYTSGLGYPASVCSNYNYSSAGPSFSLGSTVMDDPEYALVAELDDNSDFFDVSESRGAFTATDWTSGWAIWYPQGYEVCPEPNSNRPAAIAGLLQEAGIELQLLPNPAEGITYAVFHAPAQGQLQIRVLSPLGQVVKVINARVPGAGVQKVAIPIDGLSAGIYTISMDMQGARAHAALLVK